MDTLPSFPALTPDDQIWRLDWFGECAYPGSVRRYAQPSVRVGLSSLRCDPSDHAALISPDGTDHQHQHETWVPIAALPMLAIGDLWQNGHQIGSPDYQVESFKNLRINSDSASFVKAGLAIDEHFLLPLSRHPWHRLYTQSYCVALTLDEQRRLLVPCIELIRFYFGSSSNFLQILFTEHLVPEALWSSKHLNPSNRHLHLVLANHLSGASATDIGRIAESKLAWRAAAGIYTSCQKASATSHPAYPYTGFPFEGNTDLTVSGMWLPFGDHENATFLAFRIRSCSHPFPFQSLSYEAGRRKARYDTPEKSGEDKKSFSRRAQGEEKREVAETDPGSRRTQHSRTLAGPHRFPDLLRKQIWRDKIETMPHANVYLRHADGSFEHVALGEAEGNSAIPTIDLEQLAHGNIEAKNISLPWFVRMGLKQIAAHPPYAAANLAIKIVAPQGAMQPVFSLPLVIDADGVIDATQLFSKGEGSTRQRRGCFVEIAGPGQNSCYLAILEGSNQGNPPSVHQVDKTDIEVVLALELSALR